jgi:hypothetical protein
VPFGDGCSGLSALPFQTKSLHNMSIQQLYSLLEEHGCKDVVDYCKDQEDQELSVQISVWDIMELSQSDRQEFFPSRPSYIFQQIQMIKKKLAPGFRRQTHLQ